MSKNCDIIIPVYNSPDWLELCVEALYMSDISKCINKVILVDDCSDEATKKLIKTLKNKHENLEVLANDINLGFVKTCNKGLRVTEEDYIMLLNSDCLLAEDSTKKMIDILESNSKIGLICPLSNNAANLSIDIPNDLNYIQFDKIIEKKFRGEYLDACTIVGNCMIISRQCYEKTGGLDEAYGFGYGEETDYQFKAASNGFNAVVAVDTFVFHKSQMSFGNGDKLNERKMKNRDLFFERWGKEYNERMKEYIKKDPVKYVLNNLNESDYNFVKSLKTSYFDEKFIYKVKLLDEKYSNNLPRISESQRSSKIIRLIKKAKVTYKREGLRRVIKKIIKYLMKKIFLNKIINVLEVNTQSNPIKNNKISNFNDFIFIVDTDNECALNKANQLVEKLNYYKITTDLIDIDKIDVSFIKDYRGFVLIECSLSEKLIEFIKSAKRLNKSIFWSGDNENDLELIKSFKIDGIISGSEYWIKKWNENGFNTFYDKEIALDKEIDFYRKKIYNNLKATQDIYLGLFKSDLDEDLCIEIQSILKENKYFQVIIFGEKEIPSELSEFKDKIHMVKTLDYYNEKYKLTNITFFIIKNPKYLQKIWIKNSLNKILTISEKNEDSLNVIGDDLYGIICKNKFSYTIKELINNPSYVSNVKENAYEHVIKNRNSVKTGLELRDFLTSNLNKNIAFILPHTNVCGGVNIVLKHCSVLQKNGFDVSIFNIGIDESSRWVDNREIPVISLESTEIQGYLDKVVASMWMTFYSMHLLTNIGEKYYLVQAFETDFYEMTDSKNRELANSTYISDNVKYITVSKWCEDWLQNIYKRETRFIRDGISLENFKHTNRDFSGKISILIEGNSESFKNVDESFEIANQLDRNKFEIIFLSSYSEPKSWYHVDKFFQRVPYEEVGEIYRSAHILIKSSILESFSYPPLEMMATGGIVVAVQNDGNKEYMVDEYNCLIYEQGDIHSAVEKINLIIKDEELRKKLIENGLRTAQERSWNNIEGEILEAYK